MKKILKLYVEEDYYDDVTYESVEDGDIYIRCKQFK